MSNPHRVLLVNLNLQLLTQGVFKRKFLISVVINNLFVNHVKLINVKLTFLQVDQKGFCNKS